MSALGSCIKLAARSTSVQSVRTLIVPESIRRWAYGVSGFNQYGLYRNDLYQETPEVKEAIRRLPPQVQDERAFRLQRAMQLSLQKSILPKEEWVTFEEDQEKGRYLDVLLKEVKKEEEEKRAWSRKA